MNSRIKQIRLNANLTTRAFGERIGITSSSVSLLESGKNNPSEQTIRAICREFHVDRRWLETGEGVPFAPHAEDDALIDEVLSGDSEFVRAVIRGVARTPGGWEKMREIFDAIRRELDAIDRRPGP